MFPGPIRIGPVPIQPYGVMIALGFLLALWLIGRDAKRQGLDPAVLYDMSFWALLVGLVGTRLLHIAMYPREYSWNDPIGWIAVWRGGLVFQGGPPIAILFCYWYLRKRRYPIGKSADIVFTYLPLGHAVGRLGCLFRGCCYGAVTDLPWGLRFPRIPWSLSERAVGSPAYLDHCVRFGGDVLDAHWSRPVHPTQIYSSLGLVAIFIVLLVLRRKWHPFRGFALPSYFVLYGVWRFWLEFLRGDHNPTHFGWLSDQQVLSIVFAALGAVLFAVLMARNAATRKPSAR